jgi:uncharacterized protein (TIGR03067 family)
MLIAATWPAAIASVGVSPAIVASTVQAAALTAAGQQATGIITPTVNALAEGVLRAMVQTKATMVVSLALGLALGGGMLLWPGRDALLSLKSQETARQPDALAETAPDETPGAGDAREADRDKLRGAWVSVACEMNGHTFAGQELKDFRFDPCFDGKRYVIHFGVIRMAGTFELDPARNPKMITLKGDDGSLNLGIYIFTGDQLRICIAETRKPRPTEFKTKAGSGHSLIEFKRAPRVDEVREAADRFLKAALAGETEKARALAAPPVSDAQLARFQGLDIKLVLADAYVTAGPAPTSQGKNAGRALVVTEEVQVTDGQKKRKGRLVLTLLKDDERVKTKGWLVYDIDLKDTAAVEKEVKTFLEQYRGK